jgi:hypothetical protein
MFIIKKEAASAVCVCFRVAMPTINMDVAVYA